MTHEAAKKEIRSILNNSLKIVDDKSLNELIIILKSSLYNYNRISGQSIPHCIMDAARDMIVKEEQKKHDEIMAEIYGHIEDMNKTILSNAKRQNEIAQQIAALESEIAPYQEPKKTTHLKVIAGGKNSTTHETPTTRPEGSALLTLR